MPDGQANVIHADLDAFYASVEQRDDPRLRGRPVIVGGGVVLAASYEARACGVRSAMAGRAARRLCPHAIVVPPRMRAYSQASRDVFAVFERLAPVVEALSIDEAFLDVSGLERISGTPLQIALALRRAVRREVGLPITVGVARTKFLAKVASALAKPDGLLLVPPAAELRLLHLLPARRLWGVGKVTAAKLEAHGVTTVGELAALERERLVVMVGQASGRHLHALAWGRDPRPVRRREGRRTIGAQSALGRRDRAPAERAAVLTGLVDRVTRRLRKACRACRTVTLRLRFDDFKRVTRSRTLARATDETRCIRTVAIELLGASAELIERRGLTLIGITLSNLCDARRPQLRLPVDAIRPAARPGRDTWVGALTDVQPHGDSDHWRRGRDPPLGGSLDSTIDQVVERFGSQAITRGVLVGRRPPITVPLLPD